jgi:UDP-N-acetylmuramoyl-tripeptide--D-alanyl-D-alanine ligase
MIASGNLASALGDLLLNPEECDGGTPFNDIVIDSRKVKPSDLFVALRGEQTDGHRFLGDAVERGATGLLTRVRPPDLAPGVTAFLVEDTLVALQQAATRWREQQPARVIGITGSVGKTTTREAVAQLLRRNFATMESPRNFNSEIGLPLAMLALEPGHEWAVVEMGPYDRREMELLIGVGAPAIGIVTNVGPTHLERFGSLEATEEIKGLLPASLPPDGTAILNADDERVRRMRLRTPARVLLFGMREDADVRASAVTTHGLDGISFTLHLPDASDGISVRTPLAGAHHAMTALAAAAVGVAAGFSPTEIGEGLSMLRTGSRLKPRRGYSGATILDDAYNAAPLSVRAALDLLAGMPWRRIAVLGDMLELGSEEEAAHREVGGYAPGRCDRLIAIGPRARAIADGARDAGHREIQWFEEKEEATQILRQEVGADDVVLVKASHGLALETIVEALIISPGPAQRPASPLPADSESPA